MAKFIDMTGKEVGRLKVRYRVEDHVYPSGKRDVVYCCECKYGNIVDVYLRLIQIIHFTEVEVLQYVKIGLMILLSL